MALVSIKHCFSSLSLVAICLYIALLKFCHSFSARLGSEFFLTHCNIAPRFFFFSSVLCCALNYCPDQIWAKLLQSTFISRILLYTEKFRVDSMTPRFPGPVSAKQAQINHSTYALAVYLRCLCYYAVCNIAKHATLLATLVPSDQMTRF